MIKRIRPGLCYAAIFWASLVLGSLGCRTAGITPPVDLSSPGWEVRQGQAIWRPGDKKPEIAGDVVLSTHPTGSAFIQFSKTVPIVSGQVSPNGWAIEFPPENKKYSGRGNPPKKLIWLQVIRALEGEKVPDRWRLIHPSDRFIALENDESGERVELHFER